MIIALYVIAVWFGLGALGLVVMAVSIDHRRQQTMLLAVAGAAVLVAAVQILAAGRLG